MGQLWPPRRAWEKSDPWHFHCPGWKERLHSSNYIWRGRRKHSQRLSGLPNRVCAYVCTHAYMCALRPRRLCRTNPLSRTCISLFLINSHSSGWIKALIFLAKKSQSTQPPKGLDYSAVGFVIEMNSSLIIPLLIHDLALSCSNTMNCSFCLLQWGYYFCAGLWLHKLEINGKSMEDKFVYCELHSPHLIQLVPFLSQPALMPSMSMLCGKLWWSKNFNVGLNETLPTLNQFRKAKFWNLLTWYSSYYSYFSIF